MADKLVYNVTSVRSNADEVFRKFRGNRFFKGVETTLRPKFQDYQVKLVRDLTSIYESALKSTIPIHYDRGGTLRNQHIQNNISKISKSNLVGKVFIDSEIHRSLYNFDRRSYNNGSHAFYSSPTAANLADLLETSPKLQRTRPSEAEPGFSSVSGGTAGFIEQADLQYEKVKEEYINAANEDLDSFLNRRAPGFNGTQGSLRYGTDNGSIR